MAVAIRGTTPATATDNGGSATVAVTATGTRQPQAGDVLVILHCNDFYALSAMPTPTVDGSTTGVTAITGGSVDAGTDEAHIKAYYWINASTGDRAVSVTETGAHDEEKGLAVWVLSGADTGTPIDGSAVGTVDAVGSSSWVLTAASPSSSNAFLISHVNTGGGGSAGGSVTPPGSMAEAFDVNVGGLTMEGASQQLSASGSTGTRTFTPAAPGHFAGILISVKTATAPASNWTYGYGVTIG